MVMTRVRVSVRVYTFSKCYRVMVNFAFGAFDAVGWCQKCIQNVETSDCWCTEGDDMIGSILFVSFAHVIYLFHSENSNHNSDKGIST